MKFFKMILIVLYIQIMFSAVMYITGVVMGGSYNVFDWGNSRGAVGLFWMIGEFALLAFSTIWFNGDEFKRWGGK